MPIGTGTTYYGLHLRFNNRNRDVCPGCSQRMIVALDAATLESLDQTPPVYLTGPHQGSTCAMINGAQPGTCAATPVRSRTWGGLKAMYR